MVGGAPGIVPLLWGHSRCGTKALHRCGCPGKGCPWSRMPQEGMFMGKGCLREEIAYEEGMCPWEGMSAGRNVSGKGFLCER